MIGRGVRDRGVVRQFRTGGADDEAIGIRAMGLPSETRVSR